MISYETRYSVVCSPLASYRSWVLFFRHPILRCINLIWVVAGFESNHLLFSVCPFQMFDFMHTRTHWTILNQSIVPSGQSSLLWPAIALQGPSQRSFHVIYCLIITDFPQAFAGWGRKEFSLKLKPLYTKVRWWRGAFQGFVNHREKHEWVLQMTHCGQFVVEEML